ncbi:MAG TPA: DUF4307 domain-containing protein [Galbitalea sp.]
MSANDLAERYGRTRRDHRRTLIGAIVLGGVIVIVFGAWAIWVGLFQPTASVETTDVGNSRVSDTAIKVTWEISVNPGTSARCAVQALDSSFGIVGWKIVSLPPSTARSRTISAVVRTAQPALSGLIYRCWLP